jgi:hypothetical protein
MKFLIVFAASLAAFGQAGPAPKPKTVQTPYPKEVPKDAVRLTDYEWRWVDKEGKVWIFRRTPFGVAKFPEELARSEKDPGAEAGAPLEARDLGDRVEFSRQTPFGVSKWVKKKTDLSGAEKSALEAATKKQGQP